MYLLGTYVQVATAEAPVRQKYVTASQHPVTSTRRPVCCPSIHLAKPSNSNPLRPDQTRLVQYVLNVILLKRVILERMEHLQYVLDVKCYFSNKVSKHRHGSPLARLALPACLLACLPDIP